ncbi:glycosyl hydrolase family 8 [Lacinutrix mariniflava]|uniref:glycosyl hydrolase family 8 n=1 Tax=Lacinutrix mariniflava TaxID=342955 RepID=UPI0006E31028|nr:glycosyl hydrolase family 8 [Lacinutrix mariniflava]
MKNLYTLTLFAYFLFLLTTNAQINAINFENINYQYGTQPTNVLENDVYDVYVSWRNTFAVDCNNGRYRIKFDSPNENQTVSEGIAYGMLLSAYANDKELFDGLWLFYQDFLNANGVMNWKIEGCTTVIGNNGATDAELDAAYALIVADKKWQSTGTINYENDALSLINIIKAHEIENGTFVLKPGDAWGGSNATNPSYLAPGYFRAFGVYSNDTAFWNAVANKSYTILNANLSENNASYNLVSDWSKADGTYSSETSWAYDQGHSYYYDAARTPWRMAIDYVWYGDTEAASYNQLCIDFVNAQGGFNQIYPGYSQAGVAINTTYKDPTFTGAYSSAAMTSTNQSFVNNGYTELKNQPTTAYFGATLRAIYMFALSGNMYNALDNNTLSVSSTSQNAFKIFPNPVLDFLNISFKNYDERKLTFYSISGQKLILKTVNALETKLDLSELNSGVYFLNIENETFKIIKS